MSGMNATGLGRAISRRKALSLAAAAALGATLAPGTFRLRDSPVAGVPGPAELPTGFDFLDSPEFGIRVAIPADLVPVHPEVLLNEYGAMEAFREMAERSQVTLEEWLDDQFTNVDVLAIADDGASVNVMRIHSQDVPSPAMLTAEVEALQLTDVEWGEAVTTFGRATTMRSRTTLFDGALIVPGYVLWTQNACGVFSIQVTAESDEVVDALYGIVLRTLQPIPATVAMGTRRPDTAAAGSSAGRKNALDRDPCPDADDARHAGAPVTDVLVRATAVRWACDDVPGWIEVVVRDENGTGHHIVEKQPVLMKSELSPDTDFPVELWLNARARDVSGETVDVVLDCGVETVEGLRRLSVPSRNVRWP